MSSTNISLECFRDQPVPWCGACCIKNSSLFFRQCTASRVRSSCSNKRCSKAPKRFGTGVYFIVQTRPVHRQVQLRHEEASVLTFSLSSLLCLPLSLA